MQKVKSIWLDGSLIPWDEANFHFFTHSLHYGLGVFEGIRCYQQQDGGSAVFRLREHIRRLYDSCHSCLIELSIPMEDVVQGCLDTVADNDLDECYIRPLVWMGEGSMGLGSTTNTVHIGIGTFPWGPYHGDEGLDKGIRCCISSLNRISPAQNMTRAKITGHYVNSILANREAQLSGYDEAILLDDSGLVAEGAGENIFVVRDKVLHTPPLSSPILPGITRDSVLILAREMSGSLDIEICEEAFPREALYTADEVFVTGTAAEVTPVREIDGRQVANGSPGPITRAIADAYHSVLRGKDSNHLDWLMPVPAPKTA